MKKIFGLFLISSLLFFSSNIVCAAVISSGTVGTVDVVADFSNMGSVDISFELKNISDDESTETINWKVQDISLGKSTPQWVWSTSYAVIKATVTDPTISYYLYQKNTESTVYKSTTPRTNADGSTVYSGLVNKELQGGEHRGYVPLSYLFTINKLSSSDLQQEYDPDVMTPVTGEKVARYFTDQADSNFNVEYTIIACANTGGIVFYPYDESGYNPWAPNAVQQSKTAYMYFGGNFMNINRKDVFGTDQIYIIKVVE
ncbi:MAG: hypothetical protein J6T23_04605 [Elusimicrobia bacterium]|nr:hypothetical protein [Elusimicrobiota bacterium]